MSTSPEVPVKVETLGPSGLNAHLHCFPRQRSSPGLPWYHPRGGPWEVVERGPGRVGWGGVLPPTRPRTGYKTYVFVAEGLQPRESRQCPGPSRDTRTLWGGRGQDCPLWRVRLEGVGDDRQVTFPLRSCTDRNAPGCDAGVHKSLFVTSFYPWCGGSLGSFT